MPSSRDSHLNSVLAYNTVKFVSIQDRRLGCLYYCLVFLIFCWVVGFQILYGNSHLKLFDVHGTTRMTLQQPTVNGCNPRKNDCKDNISPHTALPYCKSYNGKSNPTQTQGDCIFADMVELIPHGLDTNTLFIPTRLDRTEQKRGCAKGKECSKLWKTEQANKNTFVAGIEDYTVMLVSSYVRKENMGVSRDIQGWYYECQNLTTRSVLKTEPCLGELVKKPICCHPKLKCNFEDSDDCPLRTAGSVLQTGEVTAGRKAGLRTRGGDGGRMHADAEEMASDGSDRDGDVFAIPNGDVFRLGKLLELAGLDLDHGHKLGRHNESVRQRGTAISVQVEYTNLRHWAPMGRPGKESIGYVYRVIDQTLDDVKAEVYATSQSSDGELRTIENRHGVLLHADVTGSFGEFNVVYLLVMLTTSLALLNGAKSAVDMVALYMPMKHKESYRKAKYEESGVSD